VDNPFGMNKEFDLSIVAPNQRKRLKQILQERGVDFGRPRRQGSTIDILKDFPMPNMKDSLSSELSAIKTLEKNDPILDKNTTESKEVVQPLLSKIDQSSKEIHDEY
jgi:hypothetical protein